MRQVKLGRNTALTFGVPPVITALTALLLVVTGAEAGLILGTSGVVLGLSAFVMTELSSRSSQRPSEVLVVRSSRTLGSARRAGGVADVIGDHDWIRVRVETPAEGEVNIASWRSAVIHSALARKVAAMVVESPSDDDPNDDLVELLASVASTGTHVVGLGDFRPPHNPREAEICRIEADPQRGGLGAGTLLASALRKYPDSAGLVVVRSRPAERRPRAAYSTLAAGLEGVADRICFAFAEPSHDIAAALAEVERLCRDSAGKIVVLCSTDLQAVLMSRALWGSVPDARDRILLIGYDGALDETGDFAILAAQHRVLGTVDARPSDLGALAGQEVIRRLRGIVGRGHVSLDPAVRKFT